MLTSTEEVFFDTASELTRQLQTAGMGVLRPAAFEPGQFNDETLGEISRSGNRIVIFMAFENDTHTVASSAQELTTSAGGWAWILLEPALPRPTLEGWLYIQPTLAPEGMQAFAKQVSDHTQSSFNITVSTDSVDLVHSAALYNAILLYSHAATKVQSVRGDLHDGRAVAQAVPRTVFKGVGGSIVALTDQGDRIESYEVINYVVGANDGMDSVPVGLWDSTSTQKHYKSYEQIVVWPGRAAAVPVDYASTQPICGVKEVAGRLEAVGGEFYDASLGVCRKCKVGEYMDAESISPGCLLDASECVNPRQCYRCKSKKDTYQDEEGSVDSNVPEINVPMYVPNCRRR